MHVLVADKLASFVPARLEDLGAQVTVDPSLKGESLTAALKDHDPEVLVVRSTKVTAADVAAAPSLALVIRAGAGVNTIDLDAASARGIYVANCPGMNADAVAELALGHLVNLDRRIADNVIALREGRWDKKTFGAASGLRGRRMAVLGAGKIGGAFARIARAMGMQLVFWDCSHNEALCQELAVHKAETPEEAVKGCHAVTVHLPANAETKGRIGKSVFDAMAPGTLFINTSRAEVVDHDALLAAIEEKGIRAGLDVFPDEPAEKQGPYEGAIAKHPGVYGTHHIGASTEQAEEAVGAEVVRIVEAYAGGAAIPNCVNVATRTAATHILVVRHADEVGVLANLLSALREAGHNVEDMQNTVFSGTKAAVARIAVVGEPSEATVAALKAPETVYAVAVNAIG